VTFHQLRHKKPTPTQRTIDNAMGVVSIIQPLTALPQAIDIYKTHDVSGVSLATWLGFMAIGVVFLAYGISHRIKPFIVNQILWFILDFSIVIGILIYGN
jgi:uncharacterized protein with PQ loop repeat